MSSRKMLNAREREARERGEKARNLSLAYAHGAVATEPSKASRRIAASNLSLEYIGYINSAEWAQFRAAIIRKRGRRCQQCGTTRGEINVHHRHYRTFRHERPRDVIILCRPCHDDLHRMLRCQ